jgi:diacylglycerol kinase (ATP)
MKPSPGVVEPAGLIALFGNPDAGRGEAGDVAGAMRALGADVARFDLDEIDAALEAEPARLAVAGGDGSLGSVAAAAARAGIPFAVIPTGTANDFARAAGIPLDVEEAVRIAVEGTAARRLDIAHMDRRPFLNAASLGLSPEAAERASGLKRALGPVAYTAGAVRAGLEADPVECAVRCDGEPLFEGEAWQVTVASTGAFGAGASVDADPADGRLDVVAIEAGSRARLVRHAYGLRAGEVEDQPGVHKLRCASAQIELPAPRTFNVDGELVESGTCGFEVEAAAVSVVVG